MDFASFNKWIMSRNRSVLIMGVLNVTPDSFSDGGKYFNHLDAFKRGINLIENGADIIDIGGESSRPFAKQVTLQEELDRVMPVIENLKRESNILLSIDTCKPKVMQEAIAAGVQIINDINALQGNNALKIAAQSDVIVCLMHMKGKPQNMQNSPRYQQDIISEINEFFHNRLVACMKAGVKREKIILDPGFGFGKTDFHNLTLINRINEFAIHGRPLLLGVSRKATIGRVLNKEIHQRINGALAISIYAAYKGVSILRTHDVKETKEAVKMLDAIKNSENFKEENEYT